MFFDTIFVFCFQALWNALLLPTGVNTAVFQNDTRITEERVHKMSVFDRESMFIASLNTAAVT
jgi:hypothetical protein